MKGNIIFLVLLASVLSLTLVSATTTTLNLPVAGGNYTGSITLSCTTSVNSSTIPYNVTFLRSAGTGGAATTQIAVVTNTSASQNTFTYAYDISSLSGANFNVTCLANNGTTNQRSTGIQNTVTFDSAAPGLVIEQSKITQGEVIRYKCNDAIGFGSFTLTKPDATTKTLQTGTSDYLSLTSIDTGQTGTYTFTCTDYTGNAATATVTSDAMGYSGSQLQSQNAGTGNDYTMYLIIGAVVVIAILISQKKGGR